MSRGRPPIEQGRLFDFDLEASETEPDDAAPRERPAEEPDVAETGEAAEPEPGPSADEVPLDRPGRRAPGIGSSEETPVATGSAAAPPAPRPGARFLSGGLDAALHLLLAGATAGLLSILGVPIGPRTLAALGLVLLVFSFFYTVVSLAFWGSTPGMNALDLVAEADDGGPLAFGQAARRWGGSALTVASGGLLALLIFTGRSLADRLSGSAVVQA